LQAEFIVVILIINMDDVVVGVVVLGRESIAETPVIMVS
jgi:hypothetical protein